ncbi:exosortase A [Roseateles toxinivorans]|uniref:Exosortase A n=1 Tax=Roseateles toxinivorans TaxID=270368 RepID=A0A4V3CTY1_9BURK|nr:exosortase A [Roseateles toxinivorans]TDP74608.1 exosortase A [Roseateles toxinivorans]
MNSAIGMVDPTWRRALPALLLLLAAIFWALRDTLVAMVGIWERSETFAHAYVVPPIALWLIWRRRRVLQSMPARPNAWVLFLVAGFALLWLLGELVAVNAVTQLSLVCLLILSVPAVLGLDVARALLFPLGFLLFSVPFGEFLMPQLMSWTADFTVLALRLTGIPVYREGLQFVIPSGSWSVVEACSGIRYLIASVMVGTLFGYLNYRSARRRWIFVGVSFLVPLVANWLRAYIIVLLGHFSGNKLATGVDHLIYGWLFFGVVMVVMFMIGARWAEPDAQGEPMVSQGKIGSVASAHSFWIVALCAVALVAAPRFAFLALSHADDGGAAPVLTSLERPAAGWVPAADVDMQWAPEYKNPSATLNQTFAKNGHEIGMYVAYYRHQNSERKLVSSENVLVSSKNPKWAQVSSGSHGLDVDGSRLNLGAAELRGSAVADAATPRRLLVWHLYWVNGRLTRSDHEAKAFGALYRLLGRGDDGALLVFYVEKDAAAGAQAALESFVRENLSLIEAQLRQTRGR